MRVAVSSLGTSLDAWAGILFGTCSQFLVVDTETMDFVVVSVPPEQLDPSKVSLYAIRAIANQGAEVVITGGIKDICKQTMQSLGMEVIHNIGRITVRQAIELYASGGPQAIAQHRLLPQKIAVASHGNDLESLIHAKDEPCTSFVLVDPETMQFEVVQVELADSPLQAGVNAVRAAARAGADVVITSGLRPECCQALSTLAIALAIAEEGTTVRKAIDQLRRGELSPAP